MTEAEILVASLSGQNDVDRFAIVAELAALGVPASAAVAAIEAIREGRPVREAADRCLAAIDQRLDNDLLTYTAAAPPPRGRRARTRG